MQKPALKAPLNMSTTTNNEIYTIRFVQKLAFRVTCKNKHVYERTVSVT